METLGETASTRPAAAPRPGAGLSALLRRLFSFPAVLMAGLAVVTVCTTSGRFNDPDLWWQLRVGRIIATTHSIPTSDLFSYTVAGRPWTAHEWLAQLSMYLTYAAGGEQALMLWLCVFASLILIAMFAVCWMQARDGFVAFLGGLIVWFFATVGLAIRALILGHLFLALEILLLELARTHDRRWLWALPPLFAVWSNCHATYVFGLAVLGAYWLCAYIRGEWGLLVARDSWDARGRKLLSLMLLLCPAALCCNPVGARLLWYPIDAAFRISQHAEGVNVVQEWLPPAFNSARGAGMLAVLTGILLLVVLRRAEIHLRELLLVFMALALAAQHDRMIFLFGIVAAPVLCRLLAPLLRSGPRRRQTAANAIFLFACIGVMAAAFPSEASLRGQVRKTSPVAAVDYIRRQNLPGPMLNEYVFGGYLIWALPEHKVFIDGRADVYDWAGIFPQFARWSTLAEDPRLLLDRYGIRFCLLRRGNALSVVLPYLPGWRKAYSDDVAEVFVR